MRCFVRTYICLGLILATLNSTAQQIVVDTIKSKVIEAGPEYKRSVRYQQLWGRNHRVEWTTPVRVPVLKLDTAFGGLIPYKTGGGNESKSLRLHSKSGKEYTLRSIRKSRTEVIPDNVKGTFLEDVVNDGVSMSHPYGAFAVGYMMDAAGIYHAWPRLVYLPQQKALDTFNAKYGNDLYLLEQKAEGDWHEADNLGNFRSFSNTEELLMKLQQSNTNRVDQRAYIKARLFDMLIGDWDRHEGNWSWGEVSVPGGILYKPVPRDRDQAFFYHDGLIIDHVLGAAGLFYMQAYDSVVKNISNISYAARYMDRIFTNELTLEDWAHEAVALQKALTDEVIERSVSQLPREVYAVKGKELIAKIKARRNQLQAFAVHHYQKIAVQVEVVGSKQREYFEVAGNGDNKTVVSVYRLNDKGKNESKPYYQRTFNADETKDVRLFGIDGNDVYDVKNEVEDIDVRIIGGPGRDSIIQSKRKVHIYDNKYNAFEVRSARMHLSSDTSIHKWDYKWFKKDKNGFLPLIFYNNADRIYAGLRYRMQKNRWRQEPFAWSQEFGVHYSISQNAFSAFWKGDYPNVIGKWGFLYRAEYDFIRWTNFYGMGNETVSATSDINYYRMRSREWMVNAGLYKNFGRSSVQVTGFYQQVKSINDSERYYGKFFSHNREVFETNPYAGLQLTYSYVNVDDSIVPVSGITVLANAVYTNNFRQNEFFQRYNVHGQLYIPLLDKVSLAMRFGGETIVNDDVLGSGQVYEHAIVGGPRTIRGFRRERFWGKTAVYNSNELRFITNFKSYLLAGKIGVFGFFDQGRVWMPGEKSNKLHYSYGPGIIIVPFNKYNISATYGISEEIRLVQLRLNRTL